MKWLGILLFAALLLGSPGYGNAQATGEQSVSPVTQPQGQVEGKQAQPMKKYTYQERKNYQKKAEADLAEMQQKVDGLKTKQETAPPQMRRMILKGMVSLQRGIYAGQNQLEAMKKATDKDWSGMKAELDKAMGAWNKTYEDFLAHIK
jgi:hypothetical protein